MRYPKIEFEKMTLAQLLNMFDGYNEEWIYHPLSAMPKNKKEMIDIIINELEHNGEDHGILTATDFINKYKGAGSYETLEEYAEHFE